MQFTTGSEFYLSDSFTFYLHISNESEQVAKSVIVVVAIKDPQSNNKSVLDTSSTPKDKLESQQQSDYIIRFHLSEPGSHVLGIKVQYTSAQGEVRSLTKHFKFTVSKPAAVESSLVAPLPVRPSSPSSFPDDSITDLAVPLEWIPCEISRHKLDYVLPPAHRKSQIRLRLSRTQGHLALPHHSITLSISNHLLQPQHVLSRLCRRPQHT